MVLALSSNGLAYCREGESSGIDPATLSGLTGLWNKDTGVLTDVDGIHTWEDQSGSSRDLDQGTGSSKPENAAAGPTFDGIDDYVDSTALFTQFISVSAYTAVLVMKALSAAANDAIYFNNEGVIGTAANGFWAITVRSDGDIYCGHYDGTAAQQVVIPASLNTDYIVQFKYATGEMKARVNSDAWQTLVTSNDVDLSGIFSQTLAMGRQRAASFSSNCLIQDLALYNVAHSDDDLDGVRDFYNSLRF